METTHTFTVSNVKSKLLIGPLRYSVFMSDSLAVLLETAIECRKCDFKRVAVTQVIYDRVLGCITHTGSVVIVDRWSILN